MSEINSLHTKLDYANAMITQLTKDKNCELERLRLKIENYTDMFITGIPRNEIVRSPLKSEVEVKVVDTQISKAMKRYLERKAANGGISP